MMRTSSVWTLESEKALFITSRDHIMSKCRVSSFGLTMTALVARHLGKAAHCVAHVLLYRLFPASTVLLLSARVLCRLSLMWFVAVPHL